MADQKLADTVLIVPAGGRGERLGTDVPKQFLSIAGKPIFFRAIDAVLETKRIVATVLAVPKAWRDRVQREWGSPLERRNVTIVEGGAVRSETVARAVAAAPADVPLLAIHDAVRPLVKAEEVDRVLDAAAQDGAAVLALPVRATLKHVSTELLIEKTVDRSALWEAQTPQAFRREVYLQALQRAREEHLNVTDDAQLVEHIGLPVRIVPGHAHNLKITYPEDLEIAEALLRMRA